MAKITLNNITSGYASTAALNDNFDAIEAALENTLSRDGRLNNAMLADLDMNGFNILNAASIVSEGSGGGGNVTFEGTWTHPFTYTVNDVVLYDNAVYICRIAHDTSAVFLNDSDNWTIVANNYIAPPPASSSTAIKIAILGDSFCVNPGYNYTWVDYVDRLFKKSDVNVDIANFSNGGYTFFRANSDDPAYATFGGQSAVNRLIAFAPDLIIIALGFNDTISAVDARAIATVQTDATTVINKLYAALPDATYVYASEYTHDYVNKPTAATLKNKHVIPYSQTNIIDGTTGGAVESSLENTVTPAMQTKYDNWIALDTHIKNTLTVVAGISKFTTVRQEIFKPSRLGLSHDGLHLDLVGQLFLAADMWTFLISNTTILSNFTEFTYLSLLNQFTVKDYLWSQAVTADADGWAYVQDSIYDRYVKVFALDGYSHYYSWYMANKEKPNASITIQGDLTYNLKDYTRTFILLATNCAPNEVVQYSLNGGAWTNTVLTTDRTGFGFTTSPAARTFTGLLLTAGNHTFQYRVGGFTSPIYTLTLVNTPWLYTGTAHTRIKLGSTTVATIEPTVGTWVSTGLSVLFTPTGGGRIISGSVNIGIFNSAGGTQAAASLRIVKNGTTVLQTYTNVIGYATSEVTHSMTNTVFIETFDPDTSIAAKTYTIEAMLSSDTEGKADLYINGPTSGIRFSSMKVEEVEWKEA